MLLTTQDHTYEVVTSSCEARRFSQFSQFTDRFHPHDFFSSTQPLSDVDRQY